MPMPFVDRDQFLNLLVAVDSSTKEQISNKDKIKDITDPRETEIYVQESL
jgi:hypothetical protein